MQSLPEERQGYAKMSTGQNSLNKRSRLASVKQKINNGYQEQPPNPFDGSQFRNDQPFLLNQLSPVYPLNPHAGDQTLPNQQMYPAHYGGVWQPAQSRPIQFSSPPGYLLDTPLLQHAGSQSPSVPYLSHKSTATTTPSPGTTNNGTLAFGAMPVTVYLHPEWHDIVPPPALRGHPSVIAPYGPPVTLMTQSPDLNFHPTETSVPVTVHNPHHGYEETFPPLAVETQPPEQSFKKKKKQYVGENRDEDVIAGKVDRITLTSGGLTDAPNLGELTQGDNLEVKLDRYVSRA